VWEQRFFFVIRWWDVLKGIGDEAQVKIYGRAIRRSGDVGKILDKLRIPLSVPLLSEYEQ
jgi:hypothetical protein